MDKDFKKICCSNCRHTGPFSKGCEKFKELCKKEGCGYEDSLTSDMDRWVKRHDLEMNHNCDDFENRWLQYPIPVKDVEVKNLKYNKPWQHPMGSLIKIRPCGEEYGNKTYLGFYLGDLPLSITQSYSKDTNILKLSTYNNPAIFIPELKKIIFGCESWWGVIESEKGLEDITDDVINNQWYVKLLKETKDE